MYGKAKGHSVFDIGSVPPAGLVFDIRLFPLAGPPTKNCLQLSPYMLTVPSESSRVSRSTTTRKKCEGDFRWICLFGWHFTREGDNTKAAAVVTMERTHVVYAVSCHGVHVTTDKGSPDRH